MTYRPPACPLDATHGPLTDWSSATAAWYCPNRRHEGQPPFFDSDLRPVARPAHDVTPLRRARTPAPGRGA